MSLLEQAKKIPTARAIKSKITKDDIELSIAYISGGITPKQFATVKEMRIGNTYSFAFSVIKQAIQEGEIKIIKALKS